MAMEGERQKPLQLKIITPDKTIFDDQVDHVVMPTTDGEIGIYAHHAPLITRVRKGVVRIHLMDSRLFNLSFDHGLARTRDNTLTILIHGNVKLTEHN
ncbi:MAG: ATP synthase F1 subunit epsilon [bacterium]